MTVFFSRSGWGAMPANRESADRAETTIVFVHHSATAKPHSIDEAKAQWAAFQDDHLNRPILGKDGQPVRDAHGNIIYWADLAYNIGVGPGIILEGRGWDVKGGGTGKGNKIAHASGSWDNVSVSICVIGNYKKETLDDATRASLVEALAEARARYGALAIMGDRDVNSTNCPGDNLYPLLNELWVQSVPLEDDMPTAQEVAKAILDELVPVHDYDTGANSDVPLRTALGYIHGELSLLRHHTTGAPVK